jgi:LysR family transcriptional regulator, low CO2-responsive transcriptional regulator
MLNINQLRAFYHAAKSLSFSAAAEDLFVTQPAVTKQVKLFEEFCNLKLFKRRKSRLYLTDEGKKVLVYASRIFELEKQLEDALSAIQNQKQGSLRIGTTKTYAKYFMPRLLAPFQKSFPGVIIDLDEGSSLSMTESLLDFRNALAIVAKVLDHPDITFRPLMLEEVIVIASPEHRLAGEGPVGLESLAGHPLVMKEYGSGTRKLIERLAHDENIDFNVIAQTSNMDFIKQLVRKQQALSFVVKTAVETELVAGELIAIPIKDLNLVLEIHLAYLRGYELPLAANAFQNYLLSLVDPTALPLGAQAFAGRIPNRVPAVSHAD